MRNMNRLRRKPPFQGTCCQCQKEKIVQSIRRRCTRQEMKEMGASCGPERIFAMFNPKSEDWCDECLHSIRGPRGSNQFKFAEMTNEEFEKFIETRMKAEPEKPITPPLKRMYVSPRRFPHHSKVGGQS